MVRHCLYLQPLLALAASALVSKHRSAHPFDSPPKVKSVTTVYQASAPKAWIENLAVRPNGNVLFDRLDVPETWEYDPIAKTSKLVYRYPDQIGAVGIAEYAHDKFGVIGGNFSTTNPLDTAAWNIWSLDFNSKTPAAELIVNIKEAKLLNGATSLCDSVVLACDSLLGVVFSIDVKAKTYKIASNDSTLAGAKGAEFSLGVNGIKVHDGWLYYTNDGLQAVYRMPISPVDGSQTGPAQLFAGNLPYLDDLILDEQGNVFACQNSLNTLSFIPAAGNHSAPFVGGLNSTKIAGDTAVAFGRGGEGHNVMFVTTSGAQGAPVNGTFTEPGKLVQIELDPSWWT